MSSDAEVGQITVSIVSHGHGAMASHLIDQLLACAEVSQIILTCNVPETLILPQSEKLVRIDNHAPKGFGANHNAAFTQCHEPFFCVLNPDITLAGNPFPALLNCLAQKEVVLAAPLTLSPTGSVEDSARYFPTLTSLLRKAFLGDQCRVDIDRKQPMIFPDWVAGMFMLFRSEAYSALGGFDEGYFLYYEDVDICKRTRLHGWQVALCPHVEAIHDARRASRRSLKHLRWHLASMARYLWRYR